MLRDRSQPASYTVEFVLPAGVTARQSGGSIEFVDGSGKVVAVYGSGLAFDAKGATAPVDITLAGVTGGDQTSTTTSTTTTTTTAPPTSTTVPATTTTVKGQSTATTTTTTTTGRKGSAPAPTTVAAKSEPVAGTKDERVARVEVSAPAQWASDAARVLPLTIDPSFSTYTEYRTTQSGSGWDTIVKELDPNTPYGSLPYLFGAGGNYGRIRSLMYFNLASIVAPAPNISVTNSYLQILPVNGSDCVNRKVRLAMLNGPFTEATTWSNQPAMSTVEVETKLSGTLTGVPCEQTNTWQVIDTTSIANLWMSGQKTNYGMALTAENEATSSYRSFGSGNGATPPYLVVTWGHQANESVAVSPADRAVITTNTPLLQVAPLTDPDGPADATKPLQAWFRMSTHPNAETGPHTVESGWLSANTYQVPEGLLQDGETYYWHAYTGDQVTAGRFPTWVRSFTVDMGAGGAGAHPRDQVGPVSVDLVNGNLVTSVATPPLSTSSGPLGVSLTYNSKLQSVGLRGEYYVDSGNHSFAGKSPVMVREDPAIGLWWMTEQPGPLVPPGQLLGRWTGALRVPTTGSYQLGVGTSGGVRIRLDKDPALFDQNDPYETIAYNDWTDAYVYPGFAFQAATTLTAGTTYPIKVEYYSANARSYLVLASKFNNGAGVAVPPSWLTPDTHAPVPSGWTLSASQPYVSARVGEKSLAFTDGGGHNHLYTWTGTGYAPTPGEDGVVSLDPSGRITLHEGSRTYVFDAAGRLVVSNGYADNVKIAASTCWGRDDDGLLRVIHDPDSNQGITLSYQGQDAEFTTPCGQGPVTTPDCASPGAGYETPPKGKLCLVHSAQVGTTTYKYIGGQLARITDPGDLASHEDPEKRPPITDIEYRSDGRMTTVRSPLASDAVTANVVGNDMNDATRPTRTVIAYDTAAPAPGAPPVNARVSSVVLPKTTALEARVTHSYAYPVATAVDDPATTDDDPVTTVDVAGFSAQAHRVSASWNAPANAVERVLTVTERTPAATNAATSTFDAANRPLVVTGTDGRRQSWALDGDADIDIDGDSDIDKGRGRGAYGTGRVTDAYGPGPSSCWVETTTPTTTCGDLPHVETRYDAEADDSDDGLVDLQGFDVAWWGDATFGASKTAVADLLQAVPRVRTDETSVPASGVVSTTPPAGVASPWSARYTGEILLDVPGVWPFFLSANGKGKLWIDDVVVVDAWGTHTNPVAGNTVTLLAGRHRIRIDYVPPDVGTPLLGLSWDPPGSPPLAAVPADKVFPRHGGAVRTTTHETPGLLVGDETTTVVDKLFEHDTEDSTRLLSKTVVDPLGEALTATAGYQPVGPTKTLKQTSRTLPAGGGSTMTYDYTAAIGPSCGGSFSGALRQSTGPAPGTGATGQLTQYSYDARGQVAGVRRNGESGSTCTTFDKRGRAETVTVPGFDGTPARTITIAYAKVVGSTRNPLITTVSELIDIGNGPQLVTIETRVDLLGRMVSYTDALGNVTTYEYDQAGRPTKTDGPGGTRLTTYDPQGRLSTQTLKVGLVVLATATASYDNATGEPLSVAYGNGTALSAIVRNGAGATTKLAWSLAVGATATDEVARSRTGRVTDERIDGNDAYPGTGSFGSEGSMNFQYDTVGRLRTAKVAGHDLAYEFSATAACGDLTAAGRNTNRTRVTNNGSGVDYCYGLDDRLLSTSPVSVSLTYDTRGNVDLLDGQELVFDGANRHVATKVSGQSKVTYTRDATDRILRRVEAGQSPVRYGHAGPGDSPSFVTDDQNAVQQRFASLLGGVSVTITGSAQTWSYPNVHGDVLATADGIGAKQGDTLLYNPDGMPLGATPDNLAGNFDYGWLGQHQRPLEHADGLRPVIEMGARPYLPSIGRFLAQDPVDGGSANAYDYVSADPVNGLDLTGTHQVGNLPTELHGDCVDGVTSYGLPTESEYLEGDLCRTWDPLESTCRHASLSIL